MKRIGPIAAALAADIRFRRKVERLHARGPRAVLEILAEIGAWDSTGVLPSLRKCPLERTR